MFFKTKHCANFTSVTIVGLFPPTWRIEPNYLSLVLFSLALQVYIKT